MYLFCNRMWPLKKHIYQGWTLHRRLTEMKNYIYIAENINISDTGWLRRANMH